MRDAERLEGWNAASGLSAYGLKACWLEAVPEGIQKVWKVEPKNKVLSW